MYLLMDTMIGDGSRWMYIVHTAHTVAVVLVCRECNGCRLV
jgi:hypothetical protein